MSWVVRRRPSNTDRRVKVIDLTPSGARLRTELLQRMAGRTHPLSRLSPAERRMLVKILEKLVADQTD